MNRSGIHLRRDEVDRGAVGLHAGGERALVGVEALEGRKQRRVDVEHAPVPAGDEPRRSEPHESGETDEIDAMIFEHGLERVLEGLASLPYVMWSTTAVARPAARAVARPAASGRFDATSAISAG